jgi:2-desacetyl-2-hydroxyethyl bacteriochlorophyllide A dehydrogenase
MPVSDARAFWIAAPGRGEIRDERLPAAGPNDVVVRTTFTSVSRGTEALVFAGRVPESERQRMRAPFQEGDFPSPVKYGYAAVGVVEHGPRDLTGRTVFVLHPHQTRFVVPAAAAHLVPDDVPPERAVLAANLETAINGVWDARVQVGDRVTVVGAGTVGCLVAWVVSQIGGCEVELVDVNAARSGVARGLGVRFAPPHEARGDRDVVFHASATEAGLQQALRLAGFEAAVVELSWYGDRGVTLTLGEAFHARRITLQSSQVGAVATPQRARWDHRRRMALALSLLRAPALDTLITGESDFESLPEVMPTLAAGDALCHRIRYA